jgi:hypothetical protein
LATDNVLSRSLLLKLSVNCSPEEQSSGAFACVLSLLQLHAMLCASDTERSPGRQAGAGAAKGAPVRSERSPDTTLQTLLQKRIPSVSIAPTSVASNTAEERSPDEQSATGASSAVAPKPLLQHCALKLSESVVAVVQSVCGDEFVPMRAREKSPAVLSAPCCRLALALNIADLILQCANYSIYLCGNRIKYDIKFHSYLNWQYNLWIFTNKQ